MVSDSDLSAPPATYYHATRNPFPAFPTLSDAETADVCVVGGGLTGISAALNLAERGYSVIVLEAERIGHGASGRNGGQLVSGYSCDMERIRQEVGLGASKLFWAMGQQALAEVDRRIALHDISCDRRSGYLFAARNQSQFEGLEAIGQEWEQFYGYDRTQLIRREEIPGVVGTEVYAGGLSDPGGGQMHPLNYLQGLATAAQSMGVRIFENSRVTSLVRGAKPEARTAGGVVRSTAMVLAGNAYLGGLVPEMARRLARVTSFVGATPPLEPELARAIIPGDVAVADCNTALDYFRLTGDGRLLFGAGANYAARAPRALSSHLRRRIEAVFPQLSPARLEFSWSGEIGITVSRIPDFGRLDGTLYYAQGFSGHGVALTGLAGQLIAEVISGDAERFDMFAAIKHRHFPGGPFRTPALVLAMAYYKLRDRLG